MPENQYYSISRENLKKLLRKLDQMALRDIEARNPGIDIDDVEAFRRERQHTPIAIDGIFPAPLVLELMKEIWSEALPVRADA